MASSQAIHPNSNAPENLRPVATQRGEQRIQRNSVEVSRCLHSDHRPHQRCVEQDARFRGAPWWFVPCRCGSMIVSFGAAVFGGRPANVRISLGVECVEAHTNCVSRDRRRSVAAFNIARTPAMRGATPERAGQSVPRAKRFILDLGVNCGNSTQARRSEVDSYQHRDARRLPIPSTPINRINESGRPMRSHLTPKLGLRAMLLAMITRHR